MGQGYSSFVPGQTGTAQSAEQLRATRAHAEEEAWIKSILSATTAKAAVKKFPEVADALRVVQGALRGKYAQNEQVKNTLRQLTEDLGCLVENMLDSAAGDLPSPTLVLELASLERQIVKTLELLAYDAMLLTKSIQEEEEAEVVLPELHSSELPFLEKLAQGTFTWYKGSLGCGRSVAVKACKASKTKKGSAKDASGEDAGCEDLMAQCVARDASQQLACANHPNVHRILGVCREHALCPKTLLVVSPLISAGSLHDVLHPSILYSSPATKEVHKRIKEEALALADTFAGVAAALQHMHCRAEPVPHLNLKPANILMTVLPGGMLQPKLSDFLATAPAPPPRAPSPTAPRPTTPPGTDATCDEEASCGSTDVSVGSACTAVGTQSARKRTLEAYRYMSPEQLRGNFGADGTPADIFTFAVVMAESITFRRFCAECKKAPEIVIQIVNERKRPELPDNERAAPYRDLLHGCWVEAASQRPDIQRVAAELREHWRRSRGISIEDMEEAQAAAKNEQAKAKKAAREAAEKIQEGLDGELSGWQLVGDPVGSHSEGATPTAELSANTHVQDSFAIGDKMSPGHKLRSTGSVGLYANLHLHRSLSAANGAKMLVPMATDVQIARMGKKFVMKALEPVTLRDGSKISSVVHCEPELPANVAFADPVWLCLPLPDGLQAFEVVVRECGSDVWEPLPHDDLVVESGIVCFKRSHFCAYGFKHSDWPKFTAMPYFRHRTDDVVELDLLVFPAACKKCQTNARDQAEELLGDGWQPWQAGPAVPTIQAKDGWTLQIHCGAGSPAAFVKLRVGKDVQHMRVWQVPAASPPRLSVVDEDGLEEWSEHLQPLPTAAGASSAGAAPVRPLQGLLVCGSGVSVNTIDNGIDNSTQRRDQRTDKEDTKFKAELQDLFGGTRNLPQMELMSDGLERLLKELTATNPEYLVMHGHGVSIGPDSGLSVHSPTIYQEGCLCATWQMLAEVLEEHIRNMGASCKLKFLIVRACKGYPLAKGASFLGIDAASWLQDPRVDDANEFTLKLVEQFVHKRGNAQDAFSNVLDWQRDCISGKVRDIQAAQSVTFYSARPKVFICELASEPIHGTTTVAAVFQEMSMDKSFARETFHKGNVMARKLSASDLQAWAADPSSLLRMSSCVLVVGTGPQKTETCKALAKVLSGLPLILFAGRCKQLAVAAHKAVEEGEPGCVLPSMEHIQLMEKIDRHLLEEDNSEQLPQDLDSLWQDMTGGIRTLLEEMLTQEDCNQVAKNRCQAAEEDLKRKDEAFSKLGQSPGC